MHEIAVFAVLALTLVLFVWGRWRYDVVAMMALLSLAVFGTVAPAEAFSGFGHPAVVTVAAILVLSRGLANAGIVDWIIKALGRVGERPTVQIAAMTVVVTLASGFMNNVGALALMMPVAIRMAHKAGYSPAISLMPIAFGSLLGGLMTLIGTPPNIIIATFRAETEAGAPFRMFDFLPVGGGVALVGVVFIVLLGWRLIPQRAGQAAGDVFHIEDYLAEVQVPGTSKLVGKPLRDLATLSDADTVIVGLIRNKRRILAPASFETVREGDVLIVEADPEDLKTLIDDTGLEIVGQDEIKKDLLKSDEIRIVEAVVSPGALLESRTVKSLNLRWRHGINLLGVARSGARLKQRLRNIRFQAGDVLLLQGASQTLPASLKELGCLPLAERDLQLGQPRRLAAALGLFGGALVLAATGLLPIHIAFSAAALLMVLFNFLSVREMYDSIDWPIIILLGAMIPVGGALEATGGAERMAHGLLMASSALPPVGTLILVLIGTMFLSDIINNAAATVLMAPIAMNVAHGMDASADAFLMAVAIGASCAFLTPIGHQSNTLVLGPGGYRFGDYWRMGLPLEILIVLVAIPLLLIVWPLGV